MTDTTTQQAPISWDPRRLPKSYLWGLGLGLLGFVVSFRLSSTSSTNGVVTACSSTDVAAFVFAAVCVLTAVDGARKFRAQRAQHAYRVQLGQQVPANASPWMAVAFTGVLALLAVVHVLRGLGYVGGPC